MSMWLTSIRGGLCASALLATLALAAAVPTSAARSEPTASNPDPLTADVLFAPSPFSATDKRQHLVYEIAVQNVTSLELRLERLKVLDARRGKIVASYGGAEITEIMMGPTGEPTDTLEPGGFGFVFLDLRFSRDGRIPKQLVHRFVLSPTGAAVSSERLIMVGAETDVVRRRAVELGPPLRGGSLFAGNGCCSKSGHARALIPDDDRLVVPQRYAIDFLRLEGGSTFAGDPSKNESYFIFGDKVVAAASGRVVAARDGMAENTPPIEPPVDLDTAGGNYVLVDIGHNRFAFYAHLHTGSVRVSVGERVREGQVLGLVGNTGASSEPHLHFHVTDGPSPLLANGVPYVFRQFQLEGRVIGLETGNPAIVPADPPRTRRGQLPLDADIVGFRRVDKGGD